jgi:hypothetical protein
MEQELYENVTYCSAQPPPNSSSTKRKGKENGSLRKRKPQYPEKVFFIFRTYFSIGIFYILRIDNRTQFFKEEFHGNHRHMLQYRPLLQGSRGQTR